MMPDVSQKDGHDGPDWTRITATSTWRSDLPQTVRVQVARRRIEPIVIPPPKRSHKKGKGPNKNRFVIFGPAKRLMRVTHEKNKKRKYVVAIYHDGRMELFDSINACAKAVGLGRSTISSKIRENGVYYNAEKLITVAPALSRN